MFYKHWKKFVLAIASLFWSGCGDDSSSDSNERIACNFEQMCPEYGIFYECENEQDKISGNFENCTMSYPSCTDTYFCRDEVVCFKDTDNNMDVFNCHDKQDNKTTYTEDEFNSKYYVEGQFFP